MWARQIEVCLGLWMLISPFVFRYRDTPEPRPGLWTIDFTCGGLMVLLAVVCYWYPARRAHLLHLLVAFFLIASGWWSLQGDRMAAAAAHQNHIIVGLLLATFAVVPSKALTPPETWTNFYLQPHKKP